MATIINWESDTNQYQFSNFLHNGTKNKVGLWTTSLLWIINPVQHTQFAAMQLRLKCISFVAGCFHTSFGIISYLQYMYTLKFDKYWYTGSKNYSFPLHNIGSTTNQSNIVSTQNL